MAPAKDCDGEPTGALAKAINSQFGSFTAFKKAFNAKAAGVQGSGWAWLGYNQLNKSLDIVALPNQDPLISKSLLFLYFFNFFSSCSVIGN